MRHTFVFISLTLMMLAGCATPPAPRWKPLEAAQLRAPLSLEDCLRLARRNDVRATQWRARLDAARGELDAVQGPPNPTFAASWEDLGVKDAEGVALANSTYGLNYPIFYWWTQTKEVAVAKGNLRAAQQEVAGDQRQLEIEIGSDFYGVLGAERKDRATEELLAEARQALRLAEESFKLGSVSGHDVELARAEVTQAEAELYDAQRETRSQRLALAFALGADRPLEVKVQETTNTLLRDVERLATTATQSGAVPAALIERALRADPAYAKARAEREAAESSLQLEYRKVVPLSEAQGGAARKDDPEGMGYNLSFETPIPIFNWRRGEIRKAKAELLKTQAEEEQARREAVSAFSEAWESYLSARARGAQYADRLTGVRAQLAREAQDLFAAGQISYTDLIQARREWRQAELAAVDAWREERIAAWKITRRIGETEVAQGAQGAQGETKPSLPKRSWWRKVYTYDLF